MSQIKATVTERESTCGCGDAQAHTGSSLLKRLLPSLISLFLLGTGLILDYLLKAAFFTGSIRLLWYAISYLPVGVPVIRSAFGTIRQKDLFNEFTLMVVATLGAFFIGEYPEGVAVMLFYAVGELFQESAVKKAQKNIKALLDVRPDSATVLRAGNATTISPETVSIGETIQIKAGEKVPLDGVLLSGSGSFNTSALTGESVPRTLRQGQTVLAGMVNLDSVIQVRVEKTYEDSSLARILELVQNATSRKAKTELLIRKFAHIYTPAVFFLALAITLIPALVLTNYVFTDWLYRALVFLVISCPCALVVSIPLSYFGGIGAASRNGILFKGANYLEMITRVNTVVMDKTGTLTKGVFKVQEVVSATPDPGEWHAYTALLESHSNHPVAKAIVAYFSADVHPNYPVEQVTEMPGYGIKGVVNGEDVLAGNVQLMNLYGIDYDKKIDLIKETVVIVRIRQTYAGYIVIADEIKEDAFSAIRQLHQSGIRKIIMLSGDKSSIAEEVASGLHMDEYYGDLLPEDKVKHVERLKNEPGNVVAFVGDGINDAPVLALSDVGIAMGGMGADAAIEVADVVIRTDQPSRIVTAIKIARTTRQIVIKNISLALGIKALVMIMGALGMATMWEAVFADVGVSLLAILNAIRILKKKF